MATSTATLPLDAIDELHTLQMCFSVVANLMIPSNDLSVIDREELACLLGYLTDRQATVLKGAG